MNPTLLTGTIRFSPKKVIWLYMTLIPALIFTWSSLSMNWIVLSILLTFLTACLGHSVGLHRGIIHKSYKASRWLRNILAYLFVQTGLGGPLSWLKLHYIRDYWQNQNTAPAYFLYEHSLVRDYFWNLHLTYVPDDLTPYDIPEEDLKDPWLNWLEKTWYLHVLGFAALIWSTLGFEAMIVLVFLRVSLIQLGHWYIGYVSHKHGYEEYEIDDAAEGGFNNWALGVLSFGEGFHNNHHARPSSARLSSYWYELDMGWYAIRLLEGLGLIHSVIGNTPESLKENARPIHHHENSKSWMSQKL